MHEKRPTRTDQRWRRKQKKKKNKNLKPTTTHKLKNNEWVHCLFWICIVGTHWKTIYTKALAMDHWTWHSLAARTKKKKKNTWMMSGWLAQWAFGRTSLCDVPRFGFAPWASLFPLFGAISVCEPCAAHIQSHVSPCWKQYAYVSTTEPNSEQ